MRLFPLIIFVSLMFPAARAIVRLPRPYRTGVGLAVRRIMAVPMLVVDTGLFVWAFI